MGLFSTFFNNDMPLIYQVHSLNVLGISTCGDGDGDEADDTSGPAAAKAGRGRGGGGGEEEEVVSLLLGAFSPGTIAMVARGIKHS
jgi:hypothetical protein